MKKIANIAIAIAITFFLPHVDANSNDQEIIDSFIKNHVKNEGGEEYKDARSIVTGDINQDGVQETVLLYSIEGGGGSNMAIQYLAVFQSLNGTLKPITAIHVGDTSGMNPVVDKVALNDKFIELATTEHAPDDARCCPSIEGKKYYVFTGGELKESSLPVPKISSETAIIYLLKSMEIGCELSEDIKNLFSGLYNHNTDLSGSLNSALGEVEYKKLGEIGEGEYYHYKIITKDKYYGLSVSAIEHYVGIENGIYGWSLIIDMSKDEVNKQLKSHKVNFSKSYNDMIGETGVILKSVGKNKTELLCDISG